MKIECEECGNIIVRERKQPENLELEDWEESSDKRRIYLRPSVEEMIFLDNHAGRGKRATLVHLLLKEYIEKEEEFLDIIIRQSKKQKEETPVTATG